MKNFYQTKVCVAGLFLAACDPTPPPKENTVDVVPQAQLEALERAKAVEQSMQDAVEKKEKEMRDRGT